MGGCRCTFRDCPNNSTHCAEMHFFHYPYKHVARCTMWATYANKKEFLSLPDVKLKNKVVCETHFRDECFMNYKKDRLVRQAVPTLVRLSKNLVLDYEDGEDVVPKVLAPTRTIHLIPPEKRSANNESLKTNIECSGKIEVEEILPIEQDESKEIDMTPGFIFIQEPPTKIHKPIKVTKILNPGAPQNSQAKTAPVSYTHKRSQATISAPRSVKTNINSINLGENSEDVIYEITPCDEKTDPLEIPIQLPENKMNQLVNHALETDKVDDITESEITMKVVLEESAQKISHKSSYLKTIEECAQEIEQLKQQLLEKTVVPPPAPEPIAFIPQHDNKIVHTNTQVETVTTSRKLEPSKGTPLNKAHLFNSIKKYLSPSMMALVRMEMFGGPDRMWKDDEKSVSVELLQLGENIFKHMRDEWRLRLPPMKEVQNWLAESTDILDEDDL